jgi:DNA modification methylase
VAFDPETWAAVFRVLKPGAHLVAMGGTRTYHRMACAIEDAGFEIRDTISWLYGSGFPKSHDVSKGIDRAAGAEREIVGDNGNGRPNRVGLHSLALAQAQTIGGIVTAPATDAARQWAGFGTALKPACELIVLARKPLSEGTVAANVLRWGTGAINVDGCRVGEGVRRDTGDQKGSREFGFGFKERMIGGSDLGRWPANVCTDGSDEVTAAFPDAMGHGEFDRANLTAENQIYGNAPKNRQGIYPASNGGYSTARFFYTAKADADDRLGSKHPTVKPLDLMQWLVRLVTPPKGTCLDPFSGTGTTGEAAWREGMSAVLIEAEPEYQADIRRRMALALAGPDERNRESIKARNLPRDDGPLFAQVNDYDATDDFSRSIDEAYRVIRERKANGGPGWTPP